MSTSLDVDLSTLADLDFDLVLPCEHSEHGTSHHGGRAMWKVTIVFPCCQTPGAVRLFCDTVVQRVLQRGTASHDCGNDDVPISKSWIKIEKI